MDIPTSKELLGVQSQIDADLFRKAYPEWCALAEDDQRKRPILDEIKKGGILEVVATIIFCCGVLIYILRII